MRAWRCASVPSKCRCVFGAHSECAHADCEFSACWMDYGLSGFRPRAESAIFFSRHNANMTWVCQTHRIMMALFVKYLQDGLQKYKRTWWVTDDTTMRCFCYSNGCVCIFVKYLQECTHEWDENTAMRRVALCWLSDDAFVFVKSLPLPNEDFGRRNKRWNPNVRSTLPRFVAQIEYSRPWKVLRTFGFHLLFLLPKSSFGEHKVWKLLKNTRPL